MALYINLAIVLGSLDNEALVLVICVNWIVWSAVVLTLGWIGQICGVWVLSLLWVNIMLGILNLGRVNWWRLKMWLSVISNRNWSCNHLTLLRQLRSLTQRRNSLLRRNLFLLLFLACCLFLGSCCRVYQWDTFGFFKLFHAFLFLILHLHLWIIKSFYKVNLRLWWLSFFRPLLVRILHLFDWNHHFSFFRDSWRYWSFDLRLFSCQLVLQFLFFFLLKLLSLFVTQLWLRFNYLNGWLRLNLGLWVFLLIFCLRLFGALRRWNLRFENLNLHDAILWYIIWFDFVNVFSGLIFL